MYVILQYRVKIPGQLTALYLAFAATERFFIDFIRGDRTLVTEYLSVSQEIAITLFVVSCVAFIFLHYFNNKHLTYKQSNDKPRL